MSSTQQIVTQEDVEACIKKGIDTQQLIVVDVSDTCPGAKFQIYVCSSSFAGQRLLERHRRVNGLLTEAGLMSRGIHAITIKAWTPEEWDKNKEQLPTNVAAAADAATM